MSTEISQSSLKVAEQLHSAAIHLLRILRKEDETGGLNSPRLSALSVIVFGGPITLRDLAAAEQVRPPTMTRIVNALEQQRLVTRTKNEQDGRSVYISATIAGKRLLLEGRNRRIHSLGCQIDALKSIEKSALRNAIRVLRKVLTAMR
ncbi:MAG: MarR family winged helix-turn-helix transcriptional regulator [Acidobacteriaceae bacterium]